MNNLRLNVLFNSITVISGPGKVKFKGLLQWNGRNSDFKGNREPEAAGYAVFSLQTLFFHLRYMIIAIFLLLILPFNSFVYNFVLI